jgi:WD40 repeat protein
MMVLKTKIKYGLLFLFSLIVLSSNAQFYNGMQMDFGKNRVQYKEFVWQFYRQEKFDTYFYVGGKNLADFTNSIANKRINDLENYFGYALEKRIIFLVYNNLSDFRQSNIGLVSGNDQYNIGGTTRIVNNKVFIYFEGDHVKFQKQIHAAIAEVMVNEMIYGSDFTAKVTNSTLLTLPEWYYKGIISYLSDDWNVEIDNYVRDGILTGKFEKFNRLSGNDAVYAGHSIWYFIAQKFGKQVIPNILYLTRVSKNSESGFLYVLGLPMKYLSLEWLNYYDEKYYTDEQQREFPKTGKVIKRAQKSKIYQNLTESPDGKYFAYQTNEIGKNRIYIKTNEEKKGKRIFRLGHSLDQINDYSFPLLAWHPSSKIFSYITEEKGTIRLYFYDLEEKKAEWKEIFNIDKILDYSFSQDGFNIVMSAVKNGQTDIYVFNNAANTFTKITNDLADDRFPKFINNSTEILFSSNRKNDTIGMDKTINFQDATYDIFQFDYKNKSPLLTRITQTPLSNETYPFQIKHHEYLYLSDESGIINRKYAKFDSTINFIDTVTHFRYFTESKSLTNYTRNILEQFVTPEGKSYSEILYRKGRNYLLSGIPDYTIEVKNKLTNYRIDLIKKTAELDSINKAKKIKEARGDTVIVNTIIDVQFYDTSRIDINNYIFEFQKNKQRGYLPVTDSAKATTKADSTQVIELRPRLYLTSFYTNTVVSQVDFGFLSNSYQPFTGGPFYFNPGFNIFFKVGTTDVFEDYKITGGVRFAGNFDSNEYLLSFENLKKRLDKQLVFHRLALNSAMANALIKTHTHELHYILKYPFNQVMSVRLTTNLRYDKSTFLSTDLNTLQADDRVSSWLGAKAEWIYDNTRNKGLNLYYGTRSKVFFESYKQVDAKKSSLFVIGCDFRHYQKIHRELILATRFGASTSFGNRKLIYYLGSVDNWINLSTKVQTFDRSVLIDQNQNYAYQAVATNMRGFTQNIRNGNSFAVLNNELRWPIIKYLMNRPIHSDLLENFQLIGFFDVGTAWSGSSPYSKQNAYNNEIIRNGPITIVIDKDRQPIVYGYGFGLRSRLLGYFIRADWAWGIENNVILPKIFYLSLSLDF